MFFCSNFAKWSLLYVFSSSWKLQITSMNIMVMPSHGRNRYIFLRGQSHFSRFFPGVTCFSPVENSHLGRPKTNFRRFFLFPTPISNLPPYILQFSLFSSQFLPLFLFFLASFFPIRQQKFPGQKSRGVGTLLPLPPPPPTRLLRHCPQNIVSMWQDANDSNDYVQTNKTWLLRCQYCIPVTTRHNTLKSP